MEAITVGLDETMDEDFISQGPQFIAFMVDELMKKGVGCNSGRRSRLSYQCHGLCKSHPRTISAGALAAALYIASGVRGMERGTLSEQRNPDGTETFSNMELLRLAIPRRVFTLSQIKYVIDRIVWLHKNRNLIEGLTFVEEPNILRFFFGRLKPVSNWQEKLAEKFRKDFGDSL